MTYIPPVEKIYRELSQPQPPRAKPAGIKEEAEQIALTKAQVDDVLHRRRSASPEELQHIIDHSQEYGLSDWQRNRIAVDVTVDMAQRARNVSGRRENPAAEFLSKVMGYLETPVGLIDRSFVADMLLVGSDNIQRCRNHRPPRCSCWNSQRAILWEAISQGEKSPEGWAGVRLLEALEELELATRPERSPSDGTNMTSGQ